MTSYISWISLSVTIGVLICLKCVLAKDELPSAPVCGTYLADRVQGGLTADLEAYPWMALLEYTKPNNQKGVHCSGVLINKRYVLTAAKCVSQKNLPSKWEVTSVRLGEHDLLKDQDCTGDVLIECNPPVITVPISEIIIHELYDSKTNENDIGLVRLKSDVDFSDVVKPLCLPRDPELKGFNYDNVKLTTTGWNRRTNENSSKLQGFATIISNGECKPLYSKFNVSIHDSQLCAKTDEGLDICQSLSGTALMRSITINDVGPVYYLVGMISFGPTPCENNKIPDVAIRVDSFIDWIESKVHA